MTIKSRKALKDPKRDTKQESFRLNTTLCLFLIVLTGSIAYSNSFDCPFHFDDKTAITGNTFIRTLDPVNIWGNSHNRYLPFLSFALNHHLHGYEVWGYHFVNVLIHLINALLLFGLVRTLFNTPVLKNHPSRSHRDSIALFSALLFVAHPMATQAVTYIVQRMASMTAFFYLLSLWFYLKGRLSAGRQAFLFFTTSLASALCGFVSKENSFTLPVAAVLVELLFFHEVKPATLMKKRMTWLAMAAMTGFGFFLYSRFGTYVKPLEPTWTNDNRLITPAEYLFTQFTTIPKYIQLLFLPVNQNLDYDWPLYSSLGQLPVLMGLLLIIALVALGIWKWKKSPLLAFGILFFFLAHTVESGFVPIDDLIFEHRNYLPSVGLFIVVPVLLTGLRVNRKVMMFLILPLVTVMLTSATVARNRIWKDEETLMTDIIAKSPGKARPWTNRGYIYRRRATELKTAGDMAGMKTYLNMAMNDYSSAIKCNPGFVQAYINRGKIYFDLQLDSLAILDFNRAINQDPKNSEALSNRGATLYRMGKYEEALRDLDLAISINPRSAEAYSNRALAWQGMGQLEKAIKDYKFFLRRAPGNPVVYNDIGILRTQLKQSDQAILAFTKAIEFKSDFAEAYLNRANVYRDLQRFDEALRDYAQALSINPRFDRAFSNRGTLYQQRKAYRESIDDFTRAVELNPGYGYAFYARAVSYFKYGMADSACIDMKRGATLGNAQAAQLVKVVCK